MASTNGVTRNVITVSKVETSDLGVKSSSRVSQRSGSASRRTSLIHSMSGALSNTGSLPDVESINREDTGTGENSEQDEEKLEEKQDGAPQTEKKVVKKLTEEQVIARIEDIVPRLLSIDDYRAAADCTKAFSFLKRHSAHSSNNARRVRYFDKLAELGITPLFEKVWTTHFTESFPNELGEELWNNMKGILLVIWNGTDRSKNLAQTVLENRTYLTIIKWLSDPKLAPEKTKGVHRSYTVKGLFGIIHNTLANCDARPIYREAGMVQALIPFLQAPNLMVGFNYKQL